MLGKAIGRQALTCKRDSRRFMPHLLIKNEHVRVVARDLPAKQWISTLFSGLALKTYSTQSHASLKDETMFWLGESSKFKTLYSTLPLNR